MRSPAWALAARMAAPRADADAPGRKRTITSPGTNSGPAAAAAATGPAAGVTGPPGLAGSAEQAAASARAAAASVREITPVEIAARVFNGVLHAAG
jgi:hypothetical protein